MLEPNQGRPSPCGSVRNPLRELHRFGTYKIGLVVFAELRGASPYDGRTIYATGVAGGRVSVESPATAKKISNSFRGRGPSMSRSPAACNGRGRPYLPSRRMVEGWL
jgi:hypothetical protein